jgi:hypothetical protein
MQKKNVVFTIIFVVVLVGVGVLLGSGFSRSGQSTDETASPYSAVYLATGDVYFGKLDWSPQPHLKGVWLLQRGVDGQNQPQLNIVPFKNALWGPVDEMYLNDKEIVFWTRVKNDSPVARALTAAATQQPGSVTPQAQDQVPPPAAVIPPPTPPQPSK